MIICYTVPEIWCMRDVIIFYFGLFFALLPPNSSKNQTFKEVEKNASIYHHFTHVHPKLWLDDVRFLRYDTRWTDGRTDGQKKWHIEVGALPKKVNISNTVQLSLRCKLKKKAIVSQILLSKLLYIGRIYAISKLIKEEIKKTIAQLSTWTRYFRHWYPTELSRTSMDLKIIKPHQCFLERSHAVFIEVKE